MKSIFSKFVVSRFTACVVIALLLTSGISAEAWPWNSEPQPLLHDRTAIRADAGSPLAWDRSARVLWFVAGGKLNFARWNGTTFLPRTGSEIAVNAGAGIAVDEGWHAVYFLDDNFHLQFARPSTGGVGLIRGSVGDEYLSRLLAVDNRTHSVFAYDSVARGIRLYSYQVKTKAWESSIIAPGLGKAGDTAAWDSTLRVLYSSHETADTAVPRHPRARLVGDPTGTGTLLPWPLVATAWDGRKWSSRVIDDTGVPQLPAIRATDHTVFYARRDEGEKLQTFRPVAGSRVELFSSVSGWSGADTFEDHDRYEIKAPNYPDEWQNSGSVDSTSTGVIFTTSGSPLPLKSPITVVPYYEPVWTDTPLPARLAHFRALVNPRQNRLVQHRQIYEGEIVREQTGKRIAGYLYRDADGAFARRGSSRGFFVVQFPGGVGQAPRTYPTLDATFDPANPPAEFAFLTDPSASFFAHAADLMTTATTDPNTPFVPAHLRFPTAVKSRTCGHRYDTREVNQLGGRFRDYHNYGTSYAVLSSLAGDSPSGVTFYSQSAEPSGAENTIPTTFGYSTPPLGGFRPPSDFKQSPPFQSRVWIVMVY